MANAKKNLRNRRNLLMKIKVPNKNIADKSSESHIQGEHLEKICVICVIC